MKKLQESEKDLKMFSDYTEVYEKLRDKLRQEVNDLEAKKDMLSIDMSQQRDRIAKEQRDHNQKLQSEANKASNEITRKKNDLDLRERNVERGEQDLVKRKKEIDILAKSLASLEDERRQLALNRIDIERLRIGANDKLKEATALITSAGSKLNVANSMEAQAKEALDKSNVINSLVATKSENLDKREKDLILREKNLEEISRVVEPKIKEIELREKGIEAKLKDIKNIENKVTKINEENHGMAKALEDRDGKLKAKERDLLTLEEEIKRKAILAGIKND